MKTVTLSQIETLEWGLQRFDPRRSLSLDGTTLSLAAAGELIAVLQHHPLRELHASVQWQFATCPNWTAARRLIGGSLRAKTEDSVFVSIPEEFDEKWFVSEMRSFQAKLLSKRFPQILSASLTGGVFEIVDNVWRHSGSRLRGVLAYRIVNRAFSFHISDAGAGVLATLRTNRHFAHLATSLEALEEAVKPNVSRLPDGSGLGFDKLVRSLADFWGQTRLRSGEAVLLFNREEGSPSKSQYFIPHLPGLQVSGVCRLPKSHA